MSHAIIDKTLRTNPKLSHWLKCRLLEARQYNVQRLIGEVEQLKAILEQEMAYELCQPHYSTAVDLKQIQL